MKLSDFDYPLPKELIAQEPIKPRDYSRLLILRKEKGAKLRRLPGNHRSLAPFSPLEHRCFYNLTEYLRPGDVLVLNNSKVFPARLIGKRKGTGGRIEIFLLRPLLSGADSVLAKKGNCAWQCLVGGARRKTGLTVEFKEGLKGEIIGDNKDGTWNVKFNKGEKAMRKIVEQIGFVPLPPYIKKGGSIRQTADGRNYQTVYADNNKTGSVAAPTAGFHFTPALLRKIEKMGVQIEHITLHVGLGTFAPVKVEDVRKHKMHAEYVEVKKEVIARIYLAKLQGRRIIATGTTSTRVLEAVASKFSIFNFQFSNNNKYLISKYQKQFTDFNELVDIFIYPGYKFKIVDGLITNFHLPKSTLLMLVSALAGRENIHEAYKEAIRQRYRFYSYGDAMLII